MAKKEDSQQNWQLVVGMVVGMGLGFLVSKVLCGRTQKNKGKKNDGYKRIVTGHDKNGKSIVVIEDQIPNRLKPSHRNVTVFNVWRCVMNEAISDTSNVEDPCSNGTAILLEPPPKGSNFRIIEFGPENQIRHDKEMIEKAWSEFGAQSNKLNNQTLTQRKHPFMHTTKSIDYAICLSGKIYLVLDNSQVLIEPGNVVVQRATNHAWKNSFHEPCVIAFILIDAD